MLSTLTVGTAVQIALIGAEIYARNGTHCPRKLVTLTLFFIKNIKITFKSFYIFKSYILDLMWPRSLLCLF